MGMWAMLMVKGVFFERKGLFDLVIDSTHFPGSIQIVLPSPIFPKDPKRQAEEFRSGSKTTVPKWIAASIQGGGATLP